MRAVRIARETDRIESSSLPFGILPYPPSFSPFYSFSFKPLHLPKPLCHKPISTTDDDDMVRHVVTEEASPRGSLRPASHSGPRI